MRPQKRRNGAYIIGESPAAKAYSNLGDIMCAPNSGDAEREESNTERYIDQLRDVLWARRRERRKEHFLIFPIV